MNKVNALLFVFFAAFVPSVHSAQLAGGTMVPVRLTQNINGNINQAGETVFFQVTQDVLADDAVVIPQGTFVEGKINEAKGRSSMGRAGELTLVPKSLRTPDNEIVRFVEDPLSAEGRKRTGATVAHVIMWGPLGLFAKGRAAFILLDTEYDIEVANDMDLPPVQPAPDLTPSQVSGGSAFDVQFQQYPRKINYRKGKIQDNFVLKVHPLQDNAAPLTEDQVKITRVLGYRLPTDIKPAYLKYDKRKKTWLVSFPFVDLIKYIVPGTSKVMVEIDRDQRERYATTLETKWKLK